MHGRGLESSRARCEVAGDRGLVVVKGFESALEATARSGR